MSRAFLTIAVAMAACFAVAVAPSREAVGSDLRGYGAVTASIAPDRSEFVCESPEKADTLMGKLLADMFWDAGQAHIVRTAKIGARQVVMHEWQPYGDVVVARAGKNVLVVGGASEQEALARASREPLLKAPGVLFKPYKPYPNYLDYYDLDAAKCATLGLNIENGFKYQLRSDFMKKYFPGGYISAVFFSRSSAQGVTPSYSVLDTDFALADRDGLPYSLSLSTGEWPVWAMDKWIGDIDRPGALQEPPLSVFGPPEALGMTRQRRRETSLSFLHDLIARYGDDSEMAGYELYCGDYGAETYFSQQYQAHLGYTPEGLESFRRWLREERGDTLASLGERWYGDPKQFKSWDDVGLPDPDQFYGDLGPDSFRLDEPWFWIKADNGLDQPPADTVAGWAHVARPPSEQMLAVPQGPCVWRADFDPSQWLANNGGKSVYMVLNVDNAGWKSTRVWLNGTLVGDYKSVVDPYCGPLGIDLTGKLKSGANEIVLQVARDGNPVGPVFLTNAEPRGYPYLGEHGNARYVDSLEWRRAALNFKVADTMAYVRSLDPNRPLVICATDAEVKNGQGALLREYGGSMQDTGYEASFRPLNARLGYAAGFYGSCEASGTEGVMDADPSRFETGANRRLGWTLYNGEGMYKELRDPYLYYGLEQKTGWFTKNHRKYQLVGKYLPVMPQIAVLYSSLDALLDQGHALDCDLGRSDLPSNHYDYVYVTESMLNDGLADEYPVLLDTDTRIMAPETIAALRKYVEQGGTFVALQNTGEHSLLEANSWPISDLTGFIVLGAAKSGSIQFGQSLPIFKGWEGRQIRTVQSPPDWLSAQNPAGGSIELAPRSPDAVALAHWADGTVAVGVRRLGKGRVVTIGSSFWQYGRGLARDGKWASNAITPQFFESLLTDLGVRRTADASTPSVYARSVITKNGLQQWLIAMNMSGSGKIADLGFAVAEKPAAVWDMNDGSSLPFTYDNGWVRFNGVPMGAFETKIYGVKRATLSQGVDFWWFDKTKFWTRRASAPPETDTIAPSASDPPNQAIVHWKFLADKDGSASRTDSWLAPSFDDRAWRAGSDQPWNLAYADLKDYDGIGLFRSAPFSVPAAWRGRRITLDGDGLLNYCWRSCDAYLNGRKLDHFLYPHLSVDISALLKPSGNVLCLRMLGQPVDGPHSVSGLFGSSLWIQPEITLDPSESLLGTWQAVQGDWSTSTPAEIAGVDPRLTEDGRLKPGAVAVSANHLARIVDIPAAWSGKGVYLHIVSPQINNNAATGLTLGLVLVNGQARLLDRHPNRPLDETVNITPFIKFGQANRIELWPRDAAQGGMGDSNIVINDIAIGCGPR